MSKKKKKRVVSNKRPRKRAVFDKNVFVAELERRVRTIVNSSMVPIEQRMTLLFERIQNVKANVIAANTLLERKGILEVEEFQKEFMVHEAREVGGVDSLGRMEGDPIFSLYNISS